MSTDKVNAWMDAYDNPIKDVVQAMREVIMAADGRMEEDIKWQAPTFVYKGNMASFFPRSKKAASLMFHKGAEIPGNHAILEGDGKEGRSVKIASLEQLEERKAELVAVVRAWIDLQDG